MTSDDSQGYFKLGFTLVQGQTNNISPRPAELRGLDVNGDFALLYA